MPIERNKDKMLGKDIKIKDYPNDVFKAVGKIIMHAQEWEQEYKKLATILQIPIKKINVASLNKLNKALKKENHLNDKQYRDLEGVINKSVEKDFLPMQPGDVYQTFADVEMFERDFNFSPSTPLEEGLGKFVKWYKEYYKF